MGCYIKKKRNYWYGAVIPYEIDNKITPRDRLDEAFAII